MYLTRDYEPDGKRLGTLLLRAEKDRGDVEAIVKDVLSVVKEKGDEALFAYEKKFDGADLASLVVSEEEMDEAEAAVTPSLKEALAHAKRNILSFHQAEMPVGETKEVEKGVSLMRKIVPIQKVGLYIPGGTAPLFSTVLMLSVPASVAGCPHVVLCTPPGKDGKVNPAILYAARLGGVHSVFKVGGAQAIAAMAYGTETIQRVDKIFGPGNRFVMEAKLQVASQCCAIDMPAGPSEVMVVADESSDPRYVASDLLSQAEHGSDSQAMLVLVAQDDGQRYLDEVEKAIARELSTLSRGSFLLSSLSHSHAIVVQSRERAMEIANEYAPEHLIINTKDCKELCAMVKNAGSVFLGPYAPESAGDYASGTNHTLPTSRWAVSYSGVSTDSFLKKITVQELSKEGLASLSDTIVAMAEGERLDAHAAAVKIRMEEKA